MKQLHLYILGLLLVCTQVLPAQQLEWGSYARKQAGLLVKLKKTAAGSGILVILSTVNEEEPAWVPDKGKACEMILSDASKFKGCKVIESPVLKKLTFTYKDPTNISTVSLGYIFDLASCSGSQQILINYAVECKRGEGRTGQIKIPFRITAPPEKTDKPVSQQTNPPQKDPDTTAKKPPKPPADEKIASQEHRTPSSSETEKTEREAPSPAENSLSQDQPEASQDTATEAVVSTNKPVDTSPSPDLPPKKAAPSGEEASFPYYWFILLPLLGGIGWFLYSRNKKTIPPPPPARQQPPPPPANRKPALSGLKAMPRPHKSGTYTIVNLHYCWEDTAIHQVFLSDQLMQELNDFLTDQNLRPFHEVGADAVPEIGGFILGQYKKAKEEGEWDVFLEKFTPITPGKSGIYRVSFERMAWAELAEVQDRYPALQTLAWFHTHPGHGLFLSQPDLRIHNGFFKEKYQLAMEIDSLSEGLDTAFFSRKKSGEVNNRKDRVSNRWFKWTQLMKIQQADD